MLRRRPSVRQDQKRLVRRGADGSLFDVEGGTPVTVEDLRAGLKAGRYFRATEADTGVDCTNEVLAEVIKSSVPEIEASMTALYHPLLRLLGDHDARS